MKKIIKIAKLELSVLFYSPVAWMMLAIFMIQCGVVFFDNLLALRTAISSGYEISDSITRSLLATGPGGLARTVFDSLFMYIPILTMGLMSRETSSGSIKLLLSSPVKVHEIILGKYLAIIAFGLGFLAIVVFYDVIAIAAVHNADTGLLGGQLLGIYLLICAYAAIGLFLSCLTSYQIVAFISTIAVFAVMRYIGGVWQDLDLVRDLTFFLSLSGRPEKMANGLVTTRDLCYFLIIIASFLMLCGFKLRSAMESKPWSVQAARHVVLICCALLLGYVTSRPTLIGYLDLTSQQSNTISKQSQAIAGKIDGELQMTTYANLLAPTFWSLVPSQRNNDLANWEGYQRFIRGLQMRYVYYYRFPVNPEFNDFKDDNKGRPQTDVDAVARTALENMDISGSRYLPPAKIDQLIDLQPEGYLSARTMEYQGSSAWLRMYLQDPYPEITFEQEANAALKRLIMKAPRVVFLTGNNARGTDSKADRHYQVASVRGTRRVALINQGFDVSTVDLAQQEIPADASVVVLSDPTVALTAAEQAKVTAYLEGGGNMLIAGEPGRQQILNPLLKTLGVQFKEGIVVVPDKDITPGFLGASLQSEASALGPFLQFLLQARFRVATQGAAAIDYSASGEFSTQPLLLAPPASRIEEGEMKRSLLTGDVDVSTLNFGSMTASGSEQPALPIAVSMTRTLNGKQQRVVVSGDADFMSSGELDGRRGPLHQQYIHGLFQWLSNGEFPVFSPRLFPEDVNLLVSREWLKAWMWICKAALPALLIVAGFIVLFRRRAK